MLRGINQQIIFEGHEDYQKFLMVLMETRRKYDFRLYAYCLMSNHVHFLMRAADDDLSKIFQRIGASYVYWYNKKYSRYGHLFQGRYKSEVVENKKYFLTVLRYIHQNPTNAGIVIDMGEYRWSSYGEYWKESKIKICDVEPVFAMFSKNKAEAKRLLIEFNLAENQDKCLDIERGIRLNDAEASEFIRSISGVTSPTEVQKFEKHYRNLVIKKCKEKGLSIRQIARLTGVSFGVIRSV